jgi:hypothetical protein
MKGGLTGVDAGNYVNSGKTETTFLVNPKRVTAQFSDAYSTYGEQAALPMPVLSGVLPGNWAPRYRLMAMQTSFGSPDTGG